MGFIAAAAVVAAAAVGSAAISANAAKKAASAQTKAAGQAIDFQQQSRDLSLAYQAPQRNAGYAATAALMDLTGLERKSNSATTNANNAALGADVPDIGSYAKYNFTADPGYQFRLDQGNKAITNSLAARGGVLSGGGVKAALKYSQDYASNEYQNVYNRIATIAGFGANATNASQNAVQQTSQQTSAALMNAGDARASSYVAQGNAYAGALNQIGSLAGYGMGGGGLSSYQAPSVAINGLNDPNMLNTGGGYHGAPAWG